MKLFTCPSCKQVLYFENTRCEQCGRRLAYLPELNTLSSLEPADGAKPEAVAEFVALAPAAAGQRVRLCRNYEEHDACNWAIPAEDDNSFCQSCALDDVIPNLETPESRLAWVRLETAKRRLIYSLSALGLPIEPRSATGGLAFSFKASTVEEPVFTGHSDGLITINIAEASDPFREKAREQMGEPYRTVLGHFRHEIGHYYWDRLIKDSNRLEPFRALFGDDTLDYAEAQKRHYEQGAPADWVSKFVSTYASMHPWEDWAETFAHYLHMVDTLETARVYGLAIAPRSVSGAAIPSVTTRRLHFDDFDDLITAWFPLTNALNSLNRSMGLADLYPFVLSDPAI
ncbi:MAG TPA: putative zinc-binding peptidase, partial [Vicinamibacterales bacterium]|nr:putative zinc-binding peptidase [Vicinamibacterales bacterium]